MRADELVRNPTVAVRFCIQTGQSPIDRRVATMCTADRALWDQAQDERAMAAVMASIGSRACGDMIAMAAEHERAALRLVHLDDDYRMSDVDDYSDAGESAFLREDVFGY